MTAEAAKDPDGNVDGRRETTRLRDRSDTGEIPATSTTWAARPVRRRDRRADPDFPRDTAASSTQYRRHRDPEIPPEVAERQRLELEQRDDTPTAQYRRPPRRAWRRTLLGGAVVVTLLIGYYLISLVQVYSTGRGDQARPTDAIVVMGAAQYDGRPSPQLRARLDHVVELWPRGLAPLVVVTGGNQPGDRFTEASASAAYLVERGVPSSAIVLEDRGSTSYDSLARVADLLDDRDGARADRSNGSASVLVVTDPYHSLRSRLIAEEVGLTAYTSPTNTSVVTGTRSFERHVWEAGGVAVGRITGFGWLDGLTD